MTIPNSVTSIGEDAFRSCSGLTSVNISNSLTDIGRVFIECSGLEAVTIPDGVESIGEYAFDGCTSLTSLTISQSVTSINNKAFLNCGNLETIVVDEHNTTYDSRNHCNAIIKTSSNTFVKGCKNTIIPEDITFIGNYAFYGCNNLSITSFPESVSDFGEYAFASATINEIVIPTSVTYIGKSCFSNATINRVEIPYSETPIRYSCREGSNYAYTVFTEATIGTLIIDRLLSQVSSSEYVAPFFETKIDKVYEGIHGKNWYSSSTIQDYYYPEGITDVKQNSSFKYMGSGMYYSGGNSTIERQHIPEGVTTITKIYLYPENPNNTPSVNIPSTVTTIAADAFESNMYNTLVLPAGIQSIGERAFANITSVKSITCLAENPIEINENVFPSNAFTKPLYVPVGSKGLYEAASGWSNFSNIIEIGELGNPIQFADPEIKSRCVKNYDVNGDGELSEGEALLVTSIKLYDSTSNSSNSSITSFDELGTYFTNLTSIDYYAFGEFRNMTSITIPNSVTSIGVDAFYDCRSLTTVTIPSNVTSIAATAFRRSGLSTIVVDPNNTTYDSRDNCNAIIETASNTLVLGCKNTVIPNSVTSIGEMAFSGCSGLTALNIPNSVTSIGDYAFESCNGLTSVTIPSSVASIGNSAFRDCSGLTSVTIDRTQPLSISSETFSNRANATLYVPAGSKEAYEAADYWKEFKEIKESNIYFADANVKALCVDNWDTDGDGELSKAEAAAVTELGEVFKGNEDITSFDELQYFTGLTSIGNSTFSGCTSLTSVTIPEGVTSIGTDAFCRTGLENFTVPGTVKTVDWGAFTWNTSLKRVVYEEGVQDVGNIQFYGCTSLEEVVFPSTLTARKMLGMFNFGGTNKLTHVVMPVWPQTRHAEFFGNNDDVAHSVLFDIPASTAQAYLQMGYYNISDNSALDWMREEFETEATNVEALKTAEGITASNEAKETLQNAVTAARTAVQQAGSYLAIGEQMDAVKSAAKTFLGSATIAAGTDVTAIIRNPQFNNMDFGWSINSNTYYDGCTVGYQNTEGFNEHTNGEVSIHDFVEVWLNGVPLGDGQITQTLTNLPAGVYRLEVDAIASWQHDANVEVTGVNLFAGTKNTPIATADEKPEHFTVDFTQDVTGDCTIGIDFSDTNANWVAMDNIRLLYLGEASLPHVDEEPEENYLTVGNAQVIAGGTTKMQVEMNNKEAITAFQFEVILPNGVTLSKCELTERKGDHQVSFLTLANGNYQVAALSGSSEAFNGTEGSLVNLTLHANGNMATGEYPIIIQNIELSTPLEKAFNPTNCNATLTVEEGLVADTNGDGKVSITDAVAVVNYILGNASANFVNDAADVNGDGKISITDAVAIVNIILNQGSGNVNRREVTVEELDPQ